MRLFTRCRRLAMMAAMGSLFALNGCLPPHAWADLANNVVNQIVSAFVMSHLTQTGL